MQQLIDYLNGLAPIPGEDQTIIRSFFEGSSFQEGEILYPGKGVCKKMFFICKGILRIVSSSEKGLEVTHYFYKENQFCTILAGFREDRYEEAGIRAACDVEVLSITKGSLQSLMEKLPYIKEMIEGMYQQQLLEKVHTRNAYVGEDAETQYKLFIKTQPDIASRVSQKDIASFLGITPQSLSRIRKNMR